MVAQKAKTRWWLVIGGSMIGAAAIAAGCSGESDAAGEIRSSRSYRGHESDVDITNFVNVYPATVGSRLDVARRWWRPMGSDARVVAECEQLLTQFRLADLADRPTRELPYGKRRLLEIGLAVALKPSVLLLDEPAAGVPGAERQDILDTVAALPQDVSVLLIEHDMDLVFSFASRITVLVNGAVLAEGTPDEIGADPQVKAVYLGDMEHG